MSASRALQRTIHAACRELGLDTEARHDLQLLVTGKASMSDMTEAELEAMLARLKADGFQHRPARKPRREAPRADLRYAHVLWGLLSRAGKVKKPGRDGLNAFVRSRFEGKWKSVPIDIDALREAGQINDVIRALKDWCAREGIPTERSR